jgi:hypothetical protein
MKFLYKIYSGYDGFTPRKIPERMLDGGRLVLGWTRYADVLELGHEVWVYFHGPRVAPPGVYVKGFVRAVDDAARQVILQVRELDTKTPLTDAEMSARIAEVVRRPYGRQVFVAPEELEPVAVCTLDNCRERRCDRCARWNKLPIISYDDYQWPARLGNVDEYFPGYWVVPSMCFLYRGGGRIAPAIEAGSRMFYQFKLGEAAYAFPLARGLYEALRRSGELDFGAVVPVPLSPDKSKELHRTRELARELARLLGTRVIEVLSLANPISKRRMRNDGVSVAQFERAYMRELRIDESWAGTSRVLLVDDVCTHGSTLKLCATLLRRTYPEMEVVAGTAGQMIVKEAVTDPAVLLA